MKSLFGTVSGKKITLLGWAFKKDTNDTRESAAIYVADLLIENGAEIHVFDPKVSEQQMISDLDYLNSRSSQKNRESLSCASDPYEACLNSHAVAVLTEWDMFTTLDWQRIFDDVTKPAQVFDGRNILKVNLLKDIGFNVHSLGK